ncbi:hypothetical protein [Streptomyces sp. NPDC001502]|uniref:hypothetical protein n=1 Tax=Streptomyces sp. NPDC001502 TaxID=3364578 RepID=UPI0036D16B57
MTIALFGLDSTLTDRTRSFRRWAAEFATRFGIPQEDLEAAERRCAGRRDRCFAGLKTGHGITTSIAALHAQYRRRTAELVPHRPHAHLRPPSRPGRPSLR